MLSIEEGSPKLSHNYKAANVRGLGVAGRLSVDDASSIGAGVFAAV